MIIEHAIFYIHKEKQNEFEEAFKEAATLIAATKGYRSHTLNKSIENDGKYFIFVEWDTVESHMEGFMKSPGFQQFVALMDPFLEKAEMEHLETKQRS
ncbi:antibiotic biosynthesis monooxygenase family protein [Priestia koreensis]|nr:antibiotic biosynthesis monooxygenase family protein [Priestia koreensis]UNL83581.1 antibiotic biosynthesis monooxygenase [Priestia koreensis]